MHNAFSDARSRRVFSLLVLLWILNFFDLAYTIFAHEIGGFEELNPLARHMLNPSWTLILFKVALVTNASVILLILRRHRIAEIACWCMCLVYTGLTFTWITYYSILDAIT